MVRECAAVSRRMLPWVVIFELIMIITFLAGVQASYGAEFARPAYLCAYVFLFSISCVTYIVLRKLDPETRYREMGITLQVYSLLIVAWSIFVVILDAQSGVTSTIIYIMVITAVPIISTMDIRLFLIMHLTADLILAACVFIYKDNFASFISNFIPFVAISIVAAYNYRKMRKNGYEKQVELEAASEMSWRYANIDSLTETLNRRAYNEKIEELKSSGYGKELTVWMFDINGLKSTNDNLGHAAGDEIIRGTAICIKEIFKNENIVYRIGGDEFAVISENGEPVQDIISRSEDIIKAWRGKYVPSLSVSKGYASAADHPGSRISELEKIADRQMYKEKEKYYAGCGKNEE